MFEELLFNQLQACKSLPLLFSAALELSTPTVSIAEYTTTSKKV